MFKLINIRLVYKIDPPVVYEVTLEDTKDITKEIVITVSKTAARGLRIGQTYNIYLTEAADIVTCGTCGAETDPHEYYKCEQCHVIYCLGCLEDGRCADCKTSK